MGHLKQPWKLFILFRKITVKFSFTSKVTQGKREVPVSGDMDSTQGYGSADQVGFSRATLFTY